MNPPDRLFALKQRQAFIEDTVGKSYSAYSQLDEEKRKSWPVVEKMKKVKALEEEYKENEKEIIQLELKDVSVKNAKRPVGRPREIKGLDFFSPTDEDNKLEFIANMEQSIKADEEAIGAAEEKLARFISEKKGKIAYKRKLIEQTKRKLDLDGPISLEDL